MKVLYTVADGISQSDITDILWIMNTIINQSSITPDENCLIDTNIREWCLLTQSQELANPLLFTQESAGLLPSTQESDPLISSQESQLPTRT